MQRLALRGREQPPLARNQANLCLEQYRHGVAGAADKAHWLYDEALEITRRLNRGVDNAETAQSQANLYRRTVPAGRYRGGGQGPLSLR